VKSVYLAVDEIFSIFIVATLIAESFFKQFSICTAVQQVEPNWQPSTQIFIAAHDVLDVVCVGVLYNTYFPKTNFY